MPSPSIQIAIQGRDDSRRAFESAKNSIEGLNREIGINLDRHLRNSIASMQAFQRVASLAFSAVAIVGFIQYGRQIAGVIGDAASSIGGFGQELKDATKAMEELNRQSYLMFKTLEQGQDVLNNLNRQIAELIEKQAASDPTKPSSFGQRVRNAFGLGYFDLQTFNKLGGEIKKLEEDRNKAIERRTQLQTEQNARNAAQRKAEDDRARKALEDYLRRVQQAAKALDDLKKRAFESLHAETPDFSFGTQLGVSQVPQVLGGENFGFIAPAVAQFEISDDVLQRVTAHLEELARQAQQVRDLWTGFGQSVADTLKQGLLFSRSWSDVLKSLSVDIAQLILQLIVLAKFKDIASGGGGVWGGFLSGLLGIGHRAGGGPVAANMPYWIGEKGPEIFTPSTSGTITAAGIGGQFAVSVHVSNSGAPKNAVVSKPYFDGRKMVVGIVLEDLAANGPSRQALSR